jgi:hypothetical protein
MTLYRCVDCQRYVNVARAPKDSTCPVCGGLVFGALDATADPGWLDAYRRDMERDVATSAGARARTRVGVWRALFGRSRV